MKNKVLKTIKEYSDACERIYCLIHSTDNLINPNTPEGEEIELLSLLVEKYEHEHFPIESPDPKSYKIQNGADESETVRYCTFVWWQNEDIGST